MRIEFELKFKDYLLFCSVHQFLSIPMQLLFGGGAAYILYLYAGEPSVFLRVTYAIFVYLTMWAVQLLFNVFYLSFGKNRSLLTKHIVEIQNDSFYEETKFCRAYYFWSGIAKVIGRPGFIAVYINANAAHIIPNRAFSSPIHRQEFLSTLKGRLSAA